MSPSEYQRVELRAHALLAEVPLHDVWAIDLDGGRKRSAAQLLDVLSFERFANANRAVRFLFALRGLLGRTFGWDRESADPPGESFAKRLSPADRDASLVAPGSAHGPFRVLFASDREAISEIRNATAHAFLVFALVERSGGQRLYWAVYVRPVGRFTRWYMALIDPFRRLIVYPALLRQIRSELT